MSAEGVLILDIFEGICDDLLTPGEARLLKLYCGIRTGYPPMAVDEICQRYNEPAEKLRKHIRLALVKLPRSQLEQLVGYLKDPNHPYHRDVKLVQRNILRQVLEQGLELQKLRAKLPTSSAPVVPRTQPAPLQTSASTVTQNPRVSVTDKLATALDSIGRPAHCETIYTRVEWDGPPTPIQNLPKLMLNSREFVALSYEVFALERWHNRVNDDSQRLLYCPPIPISEQVRSDKFFEVLMMVRDWLKQSPLTYGELWTRVGRHFVLYAKPQQVFDLWYALGLCTSVDFKRVQNTLVQITMPASLDMNGVREQALHALMQRLNLMPELLAALTQQLRPRREQLSAAVYGNVRDGGDIVDRLRLLEALGAVREDKGWQITRQGIALAEAYPVGAATAPQWTEAETAPQRMDFDLDL